MKKYLLGSIWFETDGFPALKHLHTASKIEGYCDSVEECYELKATAKREGRYREFFIAEIIEEDV